MNAADPALVLLTGVRGLVRRFSVAERADVSCCGVTVAQAAAVETLLASGPTRLGELARRLGIAASTLTRNIERLEASGLVRREPDPEDARSSRVALTGRGKTAALALGRQELAFARSVLEKIPEERRARVVAAFQDLLLAVREATESCCPGAYEHLMEGLPRREGVELPSPPAHCETCGCSPGLDFGSEEG